MSVLLLLALPALAFDSVCQLETGDVCEYGYQPPRNRWNNADSEHVVIFGEAFDRSGLPTDINAQFTIRTFALDDTLRGDVTETTYESYAPVRFGGERVRTRQVTPGEFAALPDFSFSLYDWISGNERCDPYSGTDDERCHQFETHMGALNSSHFLPQAQRFYEHYHVLAMDRAGECAGLEDVISAVDPLAADRFESVYLACEQEALVLEAVGQHYLQDAWSVGHMWERWGGPELSDHPEGLAAAQLVGALSGIIHGAKSVVPFADDPMCAPHADVAYIDGSTGDLELGAGDLFWDDFLADARDPNHSDQTRALLGCSINGIREVYSQTHQHHGVLGAADGAIADLTRDPLGPSCWDQRATNKALLTGFQLHVLGTAPNSTPILSDADFTALLSTTFPPVFSRLSDGATLSESQSNQYADDLLMNAAKIKVWGKFKPEGTQLANGNLLSILGAKPNSAYERGGLIDGTLPAAYVDPGLPWGLPAVSDPPVELLHLGFAEAHASDRCLDVDAAELVSLRDDAAFAMGTDRSAAACGLCAQIATPFMRIGTDAGNYDAGREPLCGYTAPSADFAYTGTYNVSGNNATAARQWCGCGGRLAVTTRGTTPGLALFDRIAETLEARPAGSGTAPGAVLPTPDSARAVALGGPFGDWAFVASNSGTLSAFELVDGEEIELDWDDDIATTDAGAPAGVSRLIVGGGPRQIALMSSASYGVVATESGLEFFDSKDLKLVGSITNADLALTGSERVYGVSVTPDDTTAFVTVWGGTSGVPTNETLIFDLTGLLAGDAPDISWAVGSFTTGGDSNNQILEVSRGGDMVAIVCPDTDRVLVVNTYPPYDEVGFYLEDAVFEPSENPIDVAWAPDDSAIYIGYIGGPASSSLATYGNVRRCDIASPGACQHAVAVEGSVRSIAISGEDTSLIVWVADSNGGLTALPTALFDAGAGTSGVDGSGLYDGTGGCLDSSRRAVPCAAAASLGQAAGEVVTW